MLPPVYARPRGGARPRQALLRHRAGRTAGCSARARGGRRSRPSRPPPGSPAACWRESSPSPMPELPEVETVRRGLDGHGRRSARQRRGGHRGAHRAPHVGRSGDRRVDRPHARRHGPPREVPAGRARLGPLAARAPADERPAGAVHGGTRRWPSTPTSSSASVTDDELRFVDPRTFGEVVVVDPSRLAEEAPDLALLGPDAFDRRCPTRPRSARCCGAATGC